MSPDLVIGVALALFLVLLALGSHIHTALFTVGIAGVLMLEGPGLLGGLVGPQPFTRTAAYSLTTIPLFVLMAQFVLQAGIVKDLFALVSRVSGGRTGPLGTLTLVAGGMLGAVSGSGSATSAALGQVAVPELAHHGMSKPLAGAVAAAAGSLSGIIPPSIILIIYGVATETSVGDLFLGALVPGTLTIGAYILVLMWFLRRARVRAPGGGATHVEPLGWRRTLIAITLTAAIVTIIFGGIFLGVFTPTEAGAIGALCGFVAALALRQVTKTFMFNALTGTVKITGMVLLILIAAQVFGRFVSLSLLPRKLIASLGPLAENPVLLVAILAVAFFVLFMFLEGAAVILMTVPILIPLLERSSIDLLWFGVLVSLICAVGTISPPVGLCVYAVGGAIGESSTAIFRYAMMFAMVATILVSTIMIVVPETVTMLPSLAK